MIAILIIVIFIAGYIAIAFENSLRISKSATALLIGVLCWTVLALYSQNPESIIHQLYQKLGEISGIIFFLLGAMTIVELIDSHGGFDLITQKVNTNNKNKLLWIISCLTFILSSFLDNLTTAIIMTSLIVKILDDKEDKFWFVGMIIIAANAGGAFSPLGDVTTTMLWIGGQISALQIIYKLFIPCIVVLIIPLLIINYKFKGQLIEIKKVKNNNKPFESIFILGSGTLLLTFVPIYKTLTHLPPFMGILLALAIIWIIVSFLHNNKTQAEKRKLSVTSALERIDSPSILFFLGILLAVSALDELGILKELADLCDQNFTSYYTTGTLLGLISAIIDNVPLVAAAQGMYELSRFPTDHPFWEFIALTSGTGGSIIIIGSAAGVAAMGIENINFIHYLKKFSWIALISYFSGILCYWLLNH
ncbi:MAG: sodium:proton antiporter NhaD [Saprospiraceae bacterium]|nr:sodium:proton antiporter NhaD [Saprospiraceae bacterium]